MALLTPSIQVKDCQEIMGPPRILAMQTLEYTWRAELYGVERGCAEGAEDAESPVSTLFVVHGEHQGEERKETSTTGTTGASYSIWLVRLFRTLERDNRSFSLASV